MSMDTLSMLNREGIETAQDDMVRWNYLHKRIDPRCSVEGYMIISNWWPVGWLLFGRPQATKCGAWYGGVKDVLQGRCECTRWQVLNLARVWISPTFQPGGEHYNSDCLPGFVDRKGVWRSTLASEALRLAERCIGLDYLLSRPPVFPDEPYQIDWIMSYCNSRLHKGLIYAAAGYELHRVNAQGIQTWRKRLPPLTEAEHAQVLRASERSLRAMRYRSQRAQLAFQI